MNLKRLGAKLRERRDELGLSQLELASKSGVARGTLQELESGRGNPTLQTILALEGILKTNLGVHALEDPPAAQSRFENLTWDLLAQIGHFYEDAEPRRQLAALYILSNAQVFYDELSNLPGGAQYAQVLKKLLKA